MAEKSPRLGSEEEEESEEEEGEEAAEAPVRPVREAAEAPVRPVREEAEDEGEEAAAVSRSPSPPPVKKQEAPPSPRPPLRPPRPSRPVFTQAGPPAFPRVSPVFYSPPLVMPVYSPRAPAFTASPPATAAAPSTSGVNLFANDGSFLELFKKKMEQTSPGGKEESSPAEEEKKPEPEKRKPVSFVGKRRGGAKLALKTGIVAKKPKTDDEEVMSHRGGAWAQYMAEVKKYKAHQCSDDDKTRPLVK